MPQKGRAQTKVARKGHCRAPTLRGELVPDLRRGRRREALRGEGERGQGGTAHRREDLPMLEEFFVDGVPRAASAPSPRLRPPDARGPAFVPKAPSSRLRPADARAPAFPILRPGRSLPRAAHPRARYGPAWSAHFAFSFSVVVSFSFSFFFFSQFFQFLFWLKNVQIFFKIISWNLFGF
jgi:hypothetical protein